MRQTPLALAAAACFLILVAQPVWAQEAQQIVVTGGFINTLGADATKSGVPARDTPITVSNYTDAFIKAIESPNVGDLYGYMTGIQRAGNTGVDINIRGFTTGQADKNTILTNGLPGLPGRFGSPPISGTDHIEVVKGASAVLYGQAQPGGFVNIITKKPEPVFGAVIDLRTSSYATSQLHGNKSSGNGAVDLTGPIDAAEMFSYRVIGEISERNLFRDFSHERVQYAAPSLQWKIGPRTTALAALEYRHSQTSYDTFLVVPNRDINLVAPITTHYQTPTDYQTEEGHTFTLSLEHQFANKVKFRAAARSVRTADLASGFDVNAIRPNLQDVQMRARGQFNRRTYDFADINVLAPFQTWGIGHQALLGVNVGRDSTNFNRTQFFNGATCPGATCLDESIYTPQIRTPALPALLTLPAVNPTTPANLNDRYTVSKASGIYATDLVTLTEQWKLSLGARKTHDSQVQSELKIPNTPATSVSYDSTQPFAGIIFQPDKAWSLYASYSTSFVPVASTNQDVKGGHDFKPVQGKQVEFGVKGELMKGRLNPTLSIFRIRNENAVSAATCNAGVGGTCSAQLGAQESKGLEFELDYRVTQGLHTALGYSYTDAKVISSADATQPGARLANSAKNSFHIWTSYEIASVPGLSTGLGVVYVGDRAGNLPTAGVALNQKIIDLPAYTTVDLGVYYSWDRYKFAFKVGNLFDKRYYESTGFTADLNLFPGAPRNLSLSLRTSF